MNSLCSINSQKQVIFDPPVLVVGASGNGLYYSTTGTSGYTLSTTNNLFSDGARGIGTNSSMFVVVGASGTSTTSIGYSTNGRTWTAVANSKTNIFASGYCVDWNGTKWIAGGSGTTHNLATSTDGINWTGIGKPTGSTIIYGIKSNGTTWVAVGESSYAIWYSTDDGANWTGVSNSIANIFGAGGRGVTYGVVSGVTTWVAVGAGSNTIAYSTNNGVSWTVVPNPSQSLFADAGFNIAWNGSRFVAVGNGAANLSPYAMIAYSDNGINWTTVSNSWTYFTGGYGGRGIGWWPLKSLWVACGQFGVYYSSNGVTWTKVTDGSFATFGWCVGALT